jgi:hypothetical protein
MTRVNFAYIYIWVTFDYYVFNKFSCLYVIILINNEIVEMDVWWVLFSSMKRAIMMFSSKKQYDYEKMRPMRADDDT